MSGTVQPCSLLFVPKFPVRNADSGLSDLSFA
jgi:hypothetical protein